MAGLKFKSARPRLPEGVRVYAIGDVHGRADLLSHLFALIDADLARRAPARVLHIMLGDYIDRGPASREVIDLILTRAARHDVVALKGNHDAFVPQALDDPSAMGDWLLMHGVETLASYGLTSANVAKSRLSDLAKAFAAVLPDSHLEFFRGLKPSFSCGDFFFAHAGVRPGIDLDRQSEEDLIWIRQDFLRHEGDFGKVIVHGHTPVRSVERRTNRIAIDTAAYATGRLTALVIEGRDLRVIDTAGAAARAA
ncbi:MAG: metallophosphoesterase family protein [Pseudomonadota bacterium]